MLINGNPITVIISPATEGDVRLMGGTDVYGRVEIFHDGIWGTVCGDYWAAPEANVICSQLGFPPTWNHGWIYWAEFGEGSGQIWLDDVNCGGGEPYLSACSHRGWGVHNCVHGDDAGVYCDRGTKIE